jgi:excisionase family DNA binding protein
MAATITRRLVSIGDAADALAVSPRTVRRYISDGQLDAVRLGRKTLRIKVDSIERFIDARPVGPGGNGQMRSNRALRCSPYVPRNGKRPRKGL